MKALLHSDALQPPDVDEDSRCAWLCFDPMAVTCLRLVHFDELSKRFVFELCIRDALPTTVYGAKDESHTDAGARILAALRLEALL